MGNQMPRKMKSRFSIKKFLYSVFSTACLFLFSAAFLFFCFASPFEATTQPQPQPQPSLDTQVEVRLPGWVLHLPLGYVAGRGRLKGGIIQEESTDLAYWMPDLNYVDIDPGIPLFAPPLFHPRDAGRNDPGDMSYVVFIRGLTKTISGDNDPVLPFVAQRNLMGDGDAGRRGYVKTIKYNLYEYKDAKKNIGGTLYSNKGISSYSGFQLFIACDNPNFDFPYSYSCEAYTYDLEKKRAYAILFPLEQMHKFGTIFSNTLSLLSRWSTT